jgi:hypothetical protein
MLSQHPIRRPASAIMIAMGDENAKSSFDVFSHASARGKRGHTSLRVASGKRSNLADRSPRSDQPVNSILRSRRNQSLPCIIVVTMPPVSSTPTRSKGLRSSSSSAGELVQLDKRRCSIACISPVASMPVKLRYLFRPYNRHRKAHLFSAERAKERRKLSHCPSTPPLEA